MVQGLKQRGASRGGRSLTNSKNITITLKKIVIKIYSLAPASEIYLAPLGENPGSVWVQEINMSNLVFI